MKACAQIVALIAEALAGGKAPPEDLSYWMRKARTIYDVACPIINRELIREMVEPGAEIRWAVELAVLRQNVPDFPGSDHLAQKIHLALIGAFAKEHGIDLSIATT